jgi:hypothetical protein
MNSWSTDETGSAARALATFVFCEKLRDMKPPERSRYTLPKPDAASAQAASDNAKRLFAENMFVVEGDANPEGVTPIPRNMMFRVYEEGFTTGSPDKPWFNDRDDIVTFVLPQPGQDSSLDPADHYRCSYWPYFTGDPRSPIGRARIQELRATTSSKLAEMKSPAEKREI